MLECDWSSFCDISSARRYNDINNQLFRIYGHAWRLTLLSLNSCRLIHPLLFTITSTRLVKCGIRVVDGYKWFLYLNSRQKTMKSVIFSCQQRTVPRYHLIAHNNYAFIQNSDEVYLNLSLFSLPFWRIYYYKLIIKQ